ncbi:serine protease 1-like [Phlebotomus argentipes]|uniref:serine protease 1-like n=1 Tax=Phlebotomus argentipes TaxID=94469 RepID=UPI002892A6D7|nr:serine protease 1-like [Phlebotomus argentipes]
MLGLVLSAILILGSCSGSIIGTNWVITAAHCLARQPVSWPALLQSINLTLILLQEPLPYLVIAASLDQADGLQSQLVLLVDFVFHPNYNSPGLGEDIALIRTGAWNFINPFIRPIELPPYNPNINQYNGQIVIASGWGPTTDTEIGAPSSILYKIEEQVIDRAVCANDLGASIPSSAMCAVDMTDPIGSVCSYDNGGPLHIKDAPRLQLIGVQSFTGSNFGGSCDGSPQGWTIVARVMPWITTVTGITSG